MIENKTLEFIEIFKQIEEYLKLIATNGEYKKFSELVRVAKSKSSIVAKYEYELHQYGQLRNAISHTSNENTKYLATPHNDSIVELRNILSKLKQPKIISDYDKKIENVISLDVTEQILKAVQLMSNYEISQLVVTKNGKLFDVLTAQTIVRFLGASKDSNLNFQLGNSLVYKEPSEKYVVMKLTDTFIDAVSEFSKSHSSGETLSAIVITENGEKNSRPLNVLTAFDLPSLFIQI